MNSGNDTTALPEHWFDSRSNAVYATLPKEEDSDQLDYDDMLEDFHQHRHLSRWERQYRTEHNLDIELDWDGRYTNDRNLQETVEEKKEQPKHGGRYSHYAAAPLSQGYGTHYTNIWVGSPTAQRKSVIVDTGSHYTAFPCKGCNNCGEEHHTDPYFDPALSQTFRPFTCRQCQLGATCKDERCYFSQSYTEGSSWEAYQVEDLVYLGGRDMLAMADPRNTDYAVNFMFGCQTSENGLFVTQLADGIMGMSAHEFTLTKQMYQKKKVEHNMFALCFRRELGTSKKGVTAGVMTLGGIDSRLESSPMLFAKNVASTGWFTVYVKNVFIRAGGGQRATSRTEDGQHVLKIPLDLAAVNSGKGVIVDSGTTDTYLHKKLAKSFASVWRTVTKKDYSHSGFLLSDDQLKRLPTILVQMRAYNTRMDPSLGAQAMDTIGYVGGLDPTSPFDVMLAIPATNYMEYSPTTGMYTSRLYFTETQGGVLGANAMQGHNVVFDWENGRVGFAESACDFEDEHSADKINGARPAKTKRFGNDCVLGQPVLTKACIHTVDSNACESGGSETLRGTEIWSRPVLKFGSDSGMSCPDSVLLDTPHQGDSPPHIVCLDGICAEYRPCQISCKDIAATTAIVNDPKGTSCPSEWSACDETCEQTIVDAIQKSDGVCYESRRADRECHTGACGKDDPCRVPYMVHAILGFQGGKKDLWDKDASELLTRSIVESVQRVGQMDTVLFTVGDVNILMASPLQGETDTGDLTDEVIGLKIVLQISFYNSKAKLVSALEEQLDSEGGQLNGQGGNGQRRDLAKNSGDIQQLFRRSRPKSTCIEADLVPLANSALAVSDAMKKPEYMRALIGQMKKEEGGDQNFEKSPFAALYNDNELVAQSRVLSTWTVRTEIEEGGTSRKGLLGRSPLTSYSLSGRTIWLTLTGVGLLILYIADRCMNPNGDSALPDGTIQHGDGSSTRPPRSARRWYGNSDSDARSGSRASRDARSDSRGSRNADSRSGSKSSRNADSRSGSKASRNTSHSRRTMASYSDDSDQALLQQLFPNGRPNEAYMSDDESSIASSQLLGERYATSRRSRGSSSSVGGDVELANRRQSPRSRRKF